MRKTKQLAGVGVLTLLSTLGCKTSQMAWWKSSTAGESTAVAHSAPASPAEVAKQTEQLAASSSQLVGSEATTPAGSSASEAPAFAATAAQPITPTPTTPSTYPTTSAPAYTPKQVATAMTSQAPTSTSPSSPVVGAIALPYNPNQAPQAAGPPAPTTPTDSGSRYGNVPGNTPSAGERYSSTAARGGVSGLPTGANPGLPPSNPAMEPAPVTGLAGAASRYGPGASPNPTVPPTTPGLSTQTGSRYSAGTNLVANPASPNVNYQTQGSPGAGNPAAPPTIGVAPAVGGESGPAVIADAPPYRPGGTSTYPNQLEVANDPQAPLR